MCLIYCTLFNTKKIFNGIYQRALFSIQDVLKYFIFLRKWESGTKLYNGFYLNLDTGSNN